MTFMNFISRLFKKDPQKRNIYHPDYSDQVEYAFQVNGVKYYRFKKAVKMPEFRNFYNSVYIDQYRRGVDDETLLAYLKTFKEHVDKGQLGDLAYKVRLLEERLKANQNLDLLYQIATVNYFTEDEDLESYSVTDNKKKLEEFKKSKDNAFFLTNPMIDIFPQLSLYTKDSKAFSRMAEVARELTEQIDSLVFSLQSKE